MPARAARSLAAPLLIAASAAWSPPALAAHPAPGGRYVMRDDSIYVGLVLQVGPGGTRLTSDGAGTYGGSRLQDQVTCGQSDAEFIDVTIGRPGGPSVRVGRAGRFAMVSHDVGPGLHGVARIKGRFVSRSAASVSFHARFTAVELQTPCAVSSTVRLRLWRQPPGGCRGHPGTTVVQSPPARVFELPGTDPTGDRATLVFGCASASGRRIALGENTDPYYLSFFQIAGSYVAYQRAECPAGCGRELAVVDLRTGNIRRDTGVTSTVPVSYAQQSAGVRPDVLRLNRNGSIAWTAGICDVRADPCPAGQTTEEVWADGDLGTRRLDAGHDILPASLALDGPVASWTSGGVARSARVD